jgi:hypothetical protein
LTVRERPSTPCTHTHVSGFLHTPVTNVEIYFANIKHLVFRAPTLQISAAGISSADEAFLLTLVREYAVASRDVSTHGLNPLLLKLTGRLVATRVLGIFLLVDLLLLVRKVVRDSLKRWRMASSVVHCFMYSAICIKTHTVLVNTRFLSDHTPVLF